MLASQPYNDGARKFSLNWAAIQPHLHVYKKSAQLFRSIKQVPLYQAEEIRCFSNHSHARFFTTLIVFHPYRVSNHFS